MPEDTRTNRSHERHTGADAIIKFDPGEDTYKKFPVTNVDWTRDYDMADIQHNGSLKPTLSTTGIRYDGSFEYEGQNTSALSTFSVTEEGGSIEHDRPVRGTLTIREYNHDDNGETVRKITFERVLITNTNRDLPADDVSSTSFDWEAENMIVKTEDFDD